MDDAKKIDLTQLPTLRTRGGGIIRELRIDNTYSDKNGKDGYLFKGIASSPHGCLGKQVRWRRDGLSQDPIVRQMGWESFDTPELDRSEASIQAIHEYIKESSIKPFSRH